MNRKGMQITENADPTKPIKPVVAKGPGKKKADTSAKTTTQLTHMWTTQDFPQITADLMHCATYLLRDEMVESLEEGLKHLDGWKAFKNPRDRTAWLSSIDLLKKIDIVAGPGTQTALKMAAMGHMKLLERLTMEAAPSTSAD